MHIALRKGGCGWALTVLIGALSAVSVRAGRITVFSNLGPGDKFEPGGYFVDGSNYSNRVIANPFNPSSTLPFRRALLALSSIQGDNSPISVYLESDNGGFPAAILDTLTQVGAIATSPPGALVEFDCKNCPFIDSGTQYWIVASEPDPDSRQLWHFSDDVGRFAFNLKGSATGPWIEASFFPLTAFEVDGLAPTPEPASIWLVVTGLLATALPFLLVGARSQCPKLHRPKLHLYKEKSHGLASIRCSLRHSFSGHVRNSSRCVQ